ncbi:MAG: glycosyltransferase [Rhodanobacteraceae bacterium]|nr:glycosyltransferase [Rhodanobacteraceae bacterium]
MANSSGTTHIVLPLAEAQGRLGMKVSVAHVEKPNCASLAPDSRWAENLKYPLSVPLNNPGISWALARRLPREVAKADLVHVHAIWNFPSWWAMRCAYKASKPYVVAPQGSLDSWALRQNRLGKKLYGALTEWPLLQSAAGLQALTLKEAAQFREAGLRAPATIIPNGVSRGETLRPRNTGGLARELGLPLGSRVLLFLSRVHEKKGLDILLRAFQMIARTHPELYLVVAGDDAGSGYRAEMEELARGLDLAARCRFIGEVSGAGKGEALAGADGFALISRSEGLPVAALEALAAGLPAVISSECNLPEVAERSAGWVVAPDVRPAALALIELFANLDHANERGIRARAMVAERFTWDKIAAQTGAVYKDILMRTGFARSN